MNSSYAYAEVLEVLENMDDVYVQKIPEKFLIFLKENASLNYQKHITASKELNGQIYSPKTLSILALINLKYWVESEEHRQKLLERYKENEKKKFEKLSKDFDNNKYDVFERTKEKETYEEKNENLPIEKKSGFKKFIDFIKRIFIDKI